MDVEIIVAIITAIGAIIGSIIGFFIQRCPKDGDIIVIPPYNDEEEFGDHDDTGHHIRFKTPILRHMLTNQTIVFPPTCSSVYIGRPNSRIPPDINLELFPHSRIVSHVHACLNCRFGVCSIEDLGSKYGTYINHIRLHPNESYCLKSGDLVSFGGDDMVFIFECS